MRYRRVLFKLWRYSAQSVFNSAIVYAVYTPYVFLWLGFAGDQYMRWLLGGVPFSLLVGWLFAEANVWFRRRFFP